MMILNDFYVFSLPHHYDLFKEISQASTYDHVKHMKPLSIKAFNCFYTRIIRISLFFINKPHNNCRIELDLTLICFKTLMSSGSPYNLI
jgi:hypothetical protein